MTEPPTAPVGDLNPGPLSLEAGALLTELMTPDNIAIYNHANFLIRFEYGLFYIS